MEISKVFPADDNVRGYLRSRVISCLAMVLQDFGEEALTELSDAEGWNFVIRGAALNSNQFTS